MYTILYVDTSLTYQTLMKNICLELGISILNVRTIDGVLQILNTSPVNLIITAMELEGASSAQLIRAINESKFRNTPVVVITGNESEEDRKRMFDLGIIDYISKLSDPLEIKRNLESYRNEDEILGRVRELHIAVCDDSRMDRHIFERIFSLANIEKVDYFSAGEDLLLSPKTYDVYLVDMVLKNMSGTHIVRKLREAGSESVIMVISGIDHYKTISSVLGMGANDYITKPFNTELFLARLKSNIRAYLLLREVRLKTRQLEQMAITDGLTGVFNRRHILYLLQREIERSKRYSSPLSIMMVDIDHFKKINDTYGHQFGDRVIVNVTGMIKREIRNVDMLGRYGGEEFLVVFPNTDMKNALLIAERIRKAMGLLKSSKHDFNVSISAGVQTWKGHDMENLVREADLSLYSAKNKGRNRVEPVSDE
ncbi:MAG: diguanylate cyclase [Spirochaetota bacterium]|jgi:two-component system cell cycle response regulator